jgi:hypothetical protein
MEKIFNYFGLFTVEQLDESVRKVKVQLMNGQWEKDTEFFKIWIGREITKEIYSELEKLWLKDEIFLRHPLPMTVNDEGQVEWFLSNGIPSKEVMSILIKHELIQPKLLCNEGLK